MGNVILPEWLRSALSECCPFCGSHAQIEIGSGTDVLFRCTNDECPIIPETSFGNGAVAAAAWLRQSAAWRAFISEHYPDGLPELTNAQRSAVCRRFSCELPPFIPSDEVAVEEFRFYLLRQLSKAVEPPSTEN